MAIKLSLMLLGGLGICRADGSDIALPTRKSRALLAYLALSPHMRRSREHLAAVFWARSAQEQARASLRQQLAAIRKSLGPLADTLLLADASNIELNSTELLVDALQLEALLASDVPAESCSLSALYPGSFLEGFHLAEQGFDDWQQQQASHYEGVALRGFCRLARSLQQRGEVRDALEVTKQALLIDGLDEEANRLKMEMLYGAGNRAEGLQHYQRYRQCLQRELGIDPDAAMQQLAEKLAAGGAEAPATKTDEWHQEIRFCRSADGVQLAYAISGQGPPLVKVSHWLMHLEYDWRSLIYGHSVADFSSYNTLVRYDKRGCGLSRQADLEPRFEDWVADLEAVIDAAGVERFALFGPSQGGAIAIEYAWRHPERVSHLILFGAFAKIHLDEIQWERERALLKLIETGWGQQNPAFRQVFTSLMLPDASREQHEDLNRMQELSCDGAMAAAIYREMGKIDVTAHAQQLKVPTLVLHSRDDARISLDYGIELASLIPNARFVPLASKNHIIMEDEPAWQVISEQVRAFIDSG